MKKNWESLDKNFRDVLEMNSPSFKSAMSFTWVEKSSWTTTLLTLICFLHKKSKILKTLGFSTCVVLSLYSDHEGRGWRRGSLQVAALGWTLLRSKTQNDILWGLPIRQLWMLQGVMAKLQFTGTTSWCFNQKLIKISILTKIPNLTKISILT